MYLLKYLCFPPLPKEVHRTLNSVTNTLTSLTKKFLFSEPTDIRVCSVTAGADKVQGSELAALLGKVTETICQEIKGYELVRHFHGTNLNSLLLADAYFFFFCFPREKLVNVLMQAFIIVFVSSVLPVSRTLRKR